jgi:hypothetical protein
MTASSFSAKRHLQRSCIEKVPEPAASRSSMALGIACRTARQTRPEPAFLWRVRQRPAIEAALMIALAPKSSALAGAAP